MCVKFCVSMHMNAAVASACLTLVLNLCRPHKAAMWLAVCVRPFSVA